MTILTIASSKGGPGKTTMAELIVGSLASEGVNVIALDADPTGGLSRWAARLYEGPAFTCHHEADEARLAHLIHRVAQEADVVVVDTAGFGNRAATVAMTAADAVLIPDGAGGGGCDGSGPHRGAGGRRRVRSAPRDSVPSSDEPCPVLNRPLSARGGRGRSACQSWRPDCPTSWPMARWGFPAACPRARRARKLPRLSPSCAPSASCQRLIDNTASVKTKYVKTARAGR